MSDAIPMEGRGRRILLATAALAGIVVLFGGSFLFMTNPDYPRLLVAIVALLVGVGGVWAFFLAMDLLVSQLPIRVRDTLRPYVFVLPALTVLGIYIIYPTIYTMYVSFFDFNLGAGAPTNFGFQNYIRAFSDPQLFVAFRNNLLWLIFVPLFSVSIGLILAVMTDRIRWERTAKSLVFLPMAISFVGASVIWRFVYYFSLFGEQIGLLNAIITSFGAEPVGWLRLEPWNNFFLITIMIWLQTGFAMVILSSAVKGVPGSLLEAARIDGASEIRIFFSVIIPYIGGTILTVTTTIVILVLKVFDIVFVMTSGRFNTDVVANMMYQQMFRTGQSGQGAALAVLLLIAVIPIMIRNIRNLDRA